MQGTKRFQNLQTNQINKILSSTIINEKNKNLLNKISVKKNDTIVKNQIKKIKVNNKYDRPIFFISAHSKKHCFFLDKSISFALLFYIKSLTQDNIMQK